MAMASCGPKFADAVPPPPEVSTVFSCEDGVDGVDTLIMKLYIFMQYIVTYIWSYMHSIY